jgi:hypothetical protein
MAGLTCARLVCTCRRPTVHQQTTVAVKTPMTTSLVDGIGATTSKPTDVPSTTCPGVAATTVPALPVATGAEGAITLGQLMQPLKTAVAQHRLPGQEPALSTSSTG